MLSALELGVALVVYTVSLPLCVMLGAAILGVRDVQDWRPNSVRLLICATAFMSLLLIFGLHYWLVMATAAATVVGLHLLTYWGLRWWVRRDPPADVS